jgi:hypothetical protein
VRVGGKQGNGLGGISNYVGSRREMEEWIHFPLARWWDRMKPLGSNTTIERTNRRQEQKFKKTLKKGGFAGLGERLRKK